MSDTFPRQQARTKRFSLGAPRSFQVSPDGTKVVFLRGKDGTDPITCLWALDLPGGPGKQGSPGNAGERLVADPAAFADLADEPEEERARRERSREWAGGVVAFATDAACALAAFAVAGEVYTAELAEDGTGPRKVNAKAPAIDPRPDPSGRAVAYVCEGALRIADLRTGADSQLIGPGADDGADVTYGLAEFVAAEEMGRYRGYWWSPDGSALLVARADNSPVQRWHIADPSNPGHQPATVRYPSAGTPNAKVSLLIAALDGSAVPVSWDAGACPYLVTADWDAGGPLVVVQSRDQRLMRLLTVNPETGGTQVLREDTDASWLDIVHGVPARTASGQLVWTTMSDDTRRLLVAEPGELADGSAAAVTPPALQVREILSVDGDTVLFSASDSEPAEISVWAYGPDGLARVSPAGADGPAGTYNGTRAGGTTVLAHSSLAEPGVTTTVLRGQPGGVGRDGLISVAAIASMAEKPLISTPCVTMLRAGQRDLRTALVLPSWYDKGSASLPLPVLMDPYGGPHSQRVLATADSFLTSQWFADQGFAVIVADGRGTPGRGPAWDRAVAGDLASHALEDQVDALTAVAELCVSQHLADLDLTKVGIRGWSFGGYLSALAVLRRPDVFHAGVAGAPVTDWRLYDTHYTERYLGDPAVTGQAYERASLISDAAKLKRPLMIIHGLADDNVVVAHSLRLSSALLAAGRPHSVLPLSGVTHMATQEEVAENLLLLQVEFLKRALGVL
ncbi:MAG TPA: prolyl oligopeptidase family serine peptidase [Streptosporangiaceae bacterium]|nr:prolyl oligopeptidase family serine peptidase [Streptosporangiaceae bacterium]